MFLQETCVLFGAHLLSRECNTSNTIVYEDYVRCTMSFKLLSSKTIDGSASKAFDFGESQFLQRSSALDSSE